MKKVISLMAVLGLVSSVAMATEQHKKVEKKAEETAAAAEQTAHEAGAAAEGEASHTVKKGKHAVKGALKHVEKKVEGETHTQ